MSVAIIGLGFVGLTLALALAGRGVKIYGVEKDQKSYSLLTKGIPTINEKGIEQFLERNLEKNLKVLSKIDLIPDNVTTLIICVATPLVSGKPNMNYLRNATKEVAKKIKGDELIIVRSTIPVGTTRKLVIPILENELQKKKVKKPLNIVFAPERTAEGVALKELYELPQIVGGFNEQSVTRAMDLFRKLTSTVIQVSSIETAEMIKLIDNSFRDVRFAYSNEIALLCEQSGVDAFECITKSNIHYPRNSIPLPSPGVGGPCLSKDPYLLVSSKKMKSFVKKNPSLILTGRNLNEFIPKFVVKKIKEKIPRKVKSKKNKIFVMGFAFKGEPETNDVRDSPTLMVLKGLKSDFKIFGHDPVVSDEVIKKIGAQPTSLDDGFKDANCVIIMNNHKFYRNLDIVSLLNKCSKPCLFVDCWRLYDKKMFENFAEIIYSGVGID